MITFLFYYFLIAIFIGLFFIHTLDNIKNILPEDEYRKMRQTIVNFMPFLPIKREIMEKLKFWLDELDLIAKEFNREYEQLCKEHLTRLQKINMELDKGSPEHIFACEYYYNLLDNRLESLRSLGQFYMLSVTKMDEVLKKSRENENPVKKTIRKTIDDFMESIENLMKLQNGLKGYLMSHIDSVKSINRRCKK